MKICGPVSRVACAIALLACAHARAGEESIKLNDGAGHDVVKSNCSICHSLDYIPMNAPVMTRARWEGTVHKMIDKFGAPINDGDAKAIVDYLSAHYAGAQ